MNSGHISKDIIQLIANLWIKSEAAQPKWRVTHGSPLTPAIKENTLNVSVHAS